MLMAIEYWFFSCSNGVATVLQSMLWAIFDGLTLAWDHGVAEIIVESDNKEAVEQINNTVSPFLL